MTKNQLDYWANKEKERTNRVTEAENYRHNVRGEGIQAVSAQGAYLRGLASQQSAALNREQWDSGGKDLLQAQIANSLADAAQTEANTITTKGTSRYRKGRDVNKLEKDPDTGQGFLDVMGATELGADWFGSLIGSILEGVGLGDVFDAAGSAAGNRGAGSYNSYPITPTRPYTRGGYNNNTRYEPPRNFVPPNDYYYHTDHGS